MVDTCLDPGQGPAGSRADGAPARVLCGFRGGILTLEATHPLAHRALVEHDALELATALLQDGRFGEAHGGQTH